SVGRGVDELAVDVEVDVVDTDGGREEGVAVCAGLVELAGDGVAGGRGAEGDVRGRWRRGDGPGLGGGAGVGVAGGVLGADVEGVAADGEAGVALGGAARAPGAAVEAALEAGAGLAGAEGEAGRGGAGRAGGAGADRGVGRGRVGRRRRGRGVEPRARDGVRVAAHKGAGGAGRLEAVVVVQAIDIERVLAVDDTGAGDRRAAGVVGAGGLVEQRVLDPVAAARLVARDQREAGAAEGRKYVVVGDHVVGVLRSLAGEGQPAPVRRARPAAAAIR